MKKFEDELKSRTGAFGIDIMTKERTYSESKLIMCFEDWVSPEDYQKVGNNLKKTENNLFEALEENKQLKDQPKLSIPKKIAEELLEGEKIKHPSYELIFSEDGEWSEELQEWMETTDKWWFIVDAYLAGKALGVELVEVEG